MQKSCVDSYALFGVDKFVQLAIVRDSDIHQVILWKTKKIL